MKLFPALQNFISEINTESISTERQQVLQALIDYVQQKKNENQIIRLNFICTHNSRRSHLSQIWAQTMAHYFGIDKVFCYSGGTEATALFPMVIETLRNTGFEISMLSGHDNPVYSIKFAANEHPLVGFSKQIGNGFNPQSEFCAIMTCDSANEACPYVPGAEKRVPITFEDPKAYDNTALQAEKYYERSLQIATEMCYVFSKI